MKTTYFLLAVLLLGIGQVFGQGHFNFTPEHPKAGEVITIDYSPSGTLTEVKTPLKAYVYQIGSTGQQANDLILKKTGNSYSAIVATDTSDNLVYFSFSSGPDYDNNANKGYWIQLYDGDQLKNGSDLSLSRFYQSYGRNAGLESDNARALQYMEAAFASDPGSKAKNLVSYVRLYSQEHPEEAASMIQKEIESRIKEGLKTEADYSELQNLYSIAKLPQQQAMVGEMRKEKFPNGSWQVNETIQNFMKEKDITRKEKLLSEIITKIGNDSAWKDLATSLPYFKSTIPGYYQQQKDWTSMEEAIQKYDITGPQLASVYNNAAWQLQETDTDLDVAEKMSAKAVDIAKKEWKTPSAKKPDYYTQSQYEESLARNYAMYADTYAMINYKLGNYKKGFPYSEEAALKISKGESADDNNTYALLAEKVQSPKKYVKQLEQFVKEGKSTSSVKDVLKRAYEKSHPAGGYADYMAALERDSYLKMVEEIKKGILKDAAPEFTLKDLNGNTVNTADLKNKILIVDFWATWCGPCKASFPGMQKMVTKYKEDPDVAFVFVDTWETSEEKAKNASEFIKAHQYDFHVLMDNDSKVVSQFKVEGIPTKFVIDKKGIIRFKSVGFSGSDDKLVSELSTMIDMAKTM